MPRKIRQLKTELRREGCTSRSAKGSHTFWTHELAPEASVSLSGGDGDDAKPYQEQQVRTLVAAIRSAKEKSGP